MQSTHATKRLAAAAFAFVAALPALSAPHYQPPGANLTYGDVRHQRSLLATPANPSVGAANLALETERRKRGIYLSGVMGLEYGNVENLFDAIDRLAEVFLDSGGLNFLGVGIDSVDLNDPDLRALLESALQEVGEQGALLEVVEAEGYGRLFLAADAPFSAGSEMLGGAWNFDFNYSAVSTVFGVAEPITDFDVDAALAELEDAFALTPADPPTVFELTGGLNLRVDPSDGSVTMALENDSLLLTKAAEISEFGLAYSRTVRRSEAGSLHVGGKAHLYRVGLARVGVRFGDVTDSEELFDAILDARFNHEIGVGLDVGALWLGSNYQVGATLTNINEPTFDYPDIDTSDFSAQNVVDFVAKDGRYTMERQLKLEASAFTDNHSLSVNFAVDANPARDPVGFEHQWLTMSGGVETGRWWLPNARIGYRRNLVGTELDYLSLGVTLLKVLNIDVASTLDTVTVEDVTLPRGVMASVGFEIAF